MSAKGFLILCRKCHIQKQILRHMHSYRGHSLETMVEIQKSIKLRKLPPTKMRLKTRAYAEIKLRYGQRPKSLQDQEQSKVEAHKANPKIYFGLSRPPPLAEWRVVPDNDAKADSKRVKPRWSCRSRGVAEFWVRESCVWRTTIR